MNHPIPDAALDSDIAIIARKGSGKSYLARGLAERLLDLKRRLVIIDPLGSWWGLKASADGEKAGYPVAVFGGEHADMPLTAKMGEPLAKLIAAENLPCVIDTSLMRKEEQGELAIDLFEGLFRFNKDALTIVLEEADVFAPQNPAKDGYAARVLHEVDRIARRGRARGLRLISLTQRPARLHKDVLSQAAALVAMRLTSPHDRAAIEDWIKGNADASQAKEVMGSLATLATGEGWVWAPDLDILSRAKFPRIKTLDTSATPKAGERRVEPKTLAQVDVKALRDAMKVEEPASNPVAKINTPDPKAIEMAEERGFRRGLEEGMTRGRFAGIAIGLERAKQAVEALRADDEANGIPVVIEGRSGAIEARVRPHVVKRSEPLHSVPPKSPPRAYSSTEFSKSEMKVLRAIAMWKSLGNATPTKVMVAGAAGYSPKSGGYANLLSRLRTAGAIEYPGAGAVSLLTDVEAMTRAEAKDALFSTMSNPQRKLFDALIPAGEMAKSDLAAATEYSASSGGFANLLSSLRSLSIVEYPRAGHVALAPWVYEVL